MALAAENWSRRSREEGAKAKERLATPLAVVTSLFTTTPTLHVHLPSSFASTWGIILDHSSICESPYMRFKIRDVPL